MISKVNDLNWAVGVFVFPKEEMATAFEFRMKLLKKKKLYAKNAKNSAKRRGGIVVEQRTNNFNLLESETI